jgi:flagellar motility protein MotE (MotC chaperone)
MTPNQRTSLQDFVLIAHAAQAIERIVNEASAPVDERIVVLVDILAKEAAQELAKIYSVCKPKDLADLLEPLTTPKERCNIQP